MQAFCLQHASYFHTTYFSSAAAYHSIYQQQQKRAHQREYPAFARREVAFASHLAKYQLADVAARDAACDAEQGRHQTTHRVAARHYGPCKPADDEAHYQPTHDLTHLCV